MVGHDELMEMIIGDTQSVTIPWWFDRHLHLRDGEMLENVLPCTLEQCATGAVVMPNLTEPITTTERAKAYAARIIRARDNYGMDLEGPFGVSIRGRDFRPRMTCYLTDHTDPEEVVRGFEAGEWCAVKLYMADQQGKGGTTGSAHGVRNLVGRYPVFAAMQECGIPLLGHFEAVENSVDEFDREAHSLERDVIPLLGAFPALKVVFEHLTDGRAADFVAEAPYNIQATVTAHHLMMNRNAMFKGGMNPGFYCKPVAKREEHRQKVRQYVTSGHPRFGAGTDSAPHDECLKSRCYGCAAGIFTAPTAVELYTTVFDEDGRLDHLGAFLSSNFVELYGMKVSEQKMTIKRRELVVPQTVGGVQVFKGGEKLGWKLVD